MGRGSSRHGMVSRFSVVMGSLGGLGVAILGVKSTEAKCITSCDFTTCNYSTTSSYSQSSRQGSANQPTRNLPVMDMVRPARLIVPETWTRLRHLGGPFKTSASQRSPYWVKGLIGKSCSKAPQLRAGPCQRTYLW